MQHKQEPKSIHSRVEYLAPAKKDLDFYDKIGSILSVGGVKGLGVYEEQITLRK